MNSVEEVLMEEAVLFSSLTLYLLGEVFAVWSPNTAPSWETVDRPRIPYLYKLRTIPYSCATLDTFNDKD